MAKRAGSITSKKVRKSPKKTKKRLAIKKQRKAERLAKKRI